MVEDGDDGRGPVLPSDLCETHPLTRMSQRDEGRARKSDSRLLWHPETQTRDTALEMRDAGKVWGQSEGSAEEHLVWARGRGWRRSPES